MLDIKKIRENFPILGRQVHNVPLVYFDNAASSQKPQFVIEAIKKYYTEDHSNVHRGVHFLSARATEKFEAAREKVRNFINARHSHEIIFTKGTTDSINLVASSFGKKFLEKNDEVIISVMEHHSNIVPWQMICEERGATIKVIPMTDKGELIIEKFKSLLSDKTKIVAVNHISNTLGTVNPVKEIIATVRDFNKSIAVLIDGAQAAPHQGINVQELDADFYALSSHKMYGPTGIGILYGKEAWLDAIPPYQGGGEMVKNVTFEKTTYNNLPFKFEAGTPHIEGVIGFAAAIDYLEQTGYKNISEYEKELLVYATEKLSGIENLRIIGTASNKAPVISFLIGKAHPYDVGVILDQLGIAVRTGHHCTQPLMDRFNIPGTVRASFAFYNTKEEIDVLVAGIFRANKILS